MTTTATVETDAVPRVRIDTGASGIWRVDVDGVRTPVRGEPIGGVLYDYDAPQQEPVYYSTASFDSADPGIEDSDLVEIPDVGVWLLPASDPLSGVRLLVGGFGGWSQPGPVSVADIPGRSRPVAVSWKRGGRRGSLTATVLEPEDYTALCGVLDQAGPYLLSYATSRWPVFAGERWVVIGDTTETVVGLPVAPAAWQVDLPLTAVDRPAIVNSTTVTIDDLVGTIDTLAGTLDGLGV